MNMSSAEMKAMIAGFQKKYLMETAHDAWVMGYISDTHPDYDFWEMLQNTIDYQEANDLEED